MGQQIGREVERSSMDLMRAFPAVMEIADDASVVSESSEEGEEFSGWRSSSAVVSSGDGGAELVGRLDNDRRTSEKWETRCCRP